MKKRSRQFRRSPYPSYEDAYEPWQTYMVSRVGIGGPPTLPDTDLFQSVRNQAY